MTISVDLTNQEIEEIKQITNLPDHSEAVGMAAREFVRLCRLRELKSVSGNVEFEENWHVLEALELQEAEFPQ